MKSLGDGENETSYALKIFNGNSMTINPIKDIVKPHLWFKHGKHVTHPNTFVLDLSIPHTFIKTVFCYLVMVKGVVRSKISREYVKVDSLGETKIGQKLTLIDISNTFSWKCFIFLKKKVWICNKREGFGRNHIRNFIKTHSNTSIFDSSLVFRNNECEYEFVFFFEVLKQIIN